MRSAWKYSPMNAAISGPSVNSWDGLGLNPSWLANMMIWGEPTDPMTSLKLITSDVVDGLSISRRLIISLKIIRSIRAGRLLYELEADSFWYSKVKNWESRSVKCTAWKTNPITPTRMITPTRIVNNPSYVNGWNCNRFKKIMRRTRIKIQEHLGLPPMPFMFSITAESNLEKAPDSWVNLREKGFDSAFHNAW